MTGFLISFETLSFNSIEFACHWCRLVFTIRLHDTLLFMTTASVGVWCLSSSSRLNIVGLYLVAYTTTLLLFIVAFFFHSSLTFISRLSLATVHWSGKVVADTTMLMFIFNFIHSSATCRAEGLEFSCGFLFLSHVDRLRDSTKKKLTTTMTKMTTIDTGKPEQQLPYIQRVSKVDVARRRLDSERKSSSQKLC